MKILQINVDRVVRAHDAAYAKALRTKADVILYQEPNKKTVERRKMICDRNMNVAIQCINPNIGIRDHKCKDGYIKILFKDFTIYNCYISPNVPLQTFKEYIDELMEDIRINKGEALIAGDLNAKSYLWSPEVQDERGRYLTEWLNSLNMTPKNDGKIPTFVRNRSMSFIDVTLVTIGLANKVRNWDVSEEESLSLHRYITYKVENKVIRKKQKWKSKPVLDKEVLRNAFAIMVTDTTNPESIISKIKMAQELACTAKSSGREREQPYWWNQEIEMLRYECNRKKRFLTRRRIHMQANLWDREKIDYDRLKREYRKAIKTSKNEHWKELCAELDNDIWGQGYKLVTRYIKYPPVHYKLGKEQTIQIVKTLFPDRIDRWNKGEKTKSVPFFTEQEILAAGNMLKCGKAPGLDHIWVESVKEIIREFPEKILKVFNNYLEKQHFPEDWKKARVVLIPKGPIKGDNTVSYRTICLLSSMSKVYEHLLKSRLEEELKDKAGLSENQYGFRKKKSTTDAINKVVEYIKAGRQKWGVIILIDIKNAFNTATWSKIVDALKRMGVSGYLINTVESYLSERELQIEEETIEMTQGVPQGSVLGPTLWNVLYDGVLRLTLPEGCRTVAYADDLALVVKAKDKDSLTKKANESLKKISHWMKDNNLELAPTKTEAVVLRGPRKKENLELELNGMQIVPEKSAKYLGVWLNEKLTFTEHIKRTIIKTEKTVGALISLMPSIGGPCSRKRHMLNGTLQSIITYGAPVWHAALKMKKYDKLLEKTQRKVLIKICCSYRTAPTEGLYVIAGVIPIGLLVKERANIYKNKDTEDIKKNERERTIGEWQDSWKKDSGKAAWTKRLIPEIKPWLECEFRQTEYYLTQFLTGHGSFVSYTKRIKKTEGDECWYCREEDSAEHTLDCPRWYRNIAETEEVLGQRLNAENIVNVMLQNAKNWKAVHELIKYIMTTKEQDERERQKEQGVA